MFSTKIKWYKIADSEELLLRTMSQSIKRIVVNKTAICLVVDQNKIKAVRDKCPHQGYAFSKGACIEDGKIVCPWHRYGFSLENGRGAGLYLEIYPCEEREDGFYLGMEYFSFF